MELDNQTRFPAALFRGVIAEERLCASLFCRVTYDWSPAGLKIATNQEWIVSAAPWDSPVGKLDSDEKFCQGGCDLMVFGHARAPRGEPVRQMEVAMSVGKTFQRRLLIVGDRVWKKNLFQWHMSEPQPFTEMPLTLARAFGGKDLWDELPVPFSDNPDGRGYYLTPEAAHNQPLPNIEHPARLVSKWTDQPEPVGIAACGMGFGPKIRRSTEFDSKTGAMTRLRETFFNAAFPDFIKGCVEPGERVIVEGVRAEGTFEFTVPSPPVRVEVAFGERRDCQMPRVDQIGMEPDRQRLFIGWRFPFFYKLKPLQRRYCGLLPA